MFTRQLNEKLHSVFSSTNTYKLYSVIIYLHTFSIIIYIIDYKKKRTNGGRIRQLTNGLTILNLDEQILWKQCIIIKYIL